MSSYTPRLCENCAFYLRGYCKRLPPVPVFYDGCIVTVFPEVKTGEWCGEFQHLPGYRDREFRT